MVSWTSIVVLALLGSTVSSSLWKRNAKHQCPSVYDKPCSSDRQCPCRPTRLICNYARVCREISPIDIDRRQRCPRIFKSRCSSNIECSGCPRLVCDDGECVYDKNNII